MKVSIVSDMITPFMGGNEVMIENLSKELVDLGLDVKWVGMRLSRNDKKHEINENGVELIRLDTPMNERRFFCFHPKLFSILKDSDVIQFHTFVSAITGKYIAKMLKKPSILMCHEFFIDKWKKMTDNKIEQFIYPKIEEFIIKSKYDCAIVPCEYTKKILIRLGYEEEKINVIPHGLEHNLFKPKRKIYKERCRLNDKFVVIYCGRFGFKGTCYSKNQKTLFDAFKIIRNEISNSVLLLAGTNFDEVKGYIKKIGLKINKDVIYLGKLKRNELPYFYSSGDVFMTSSLSEGFSFVVVESQACGTPVVAFKGAGALDETAKTQVLVEEQTPESLAEGVLRLYNSKNLYLKKVQMGIEWVRRYDWKIVAKEYKRVYEMMVNG